MSLSSYLRSRFAAILLCAGFSAIVAAVLAVCGVSRDAILLVVILAMTACLLSLLLCYSRSAAYWRRMSELTDELDNPRMVPTLLGDPVTPEQEVCSDVLSAVAKSASDDAAEYRRQAREYREYVETWVHEAKSPLAAANLMLENLAADPESAATDPARLDALGVELHRVERYVEQALFYARSESVERDYLIRRHALRDIVVAAVRESSRELIAARVAPRLGEGLDLEVFADDKWASFVVGQLIQNSVRYARKDAEGGSSVAFEGRLVDEGLADERVELVVTDNGCGVSAADLPRVFDRGFTGQNGRSHKRSTGLGLWLCARLCGKMGLSLSATSVEGEFFSVTIGFPTNKMHYYDDTEG